MTNRERNQFIESAVRLLLTDYIAEVEAGDEYDDDGNSYRYSICNQALRALDTTPEPEAEQTIVEQPKVIESTLQFGAKSIQTLVEDYTWELSEMKPEDFSSVQEFEERKADIRNMLHELSLNAAASDFHLNSQIERGQMPHLELRKG